MEGTAHGEIVEIGWSVREIRPLEEATETDGVGDLVRLPVEIEGGGPVRAIEPRDDWMFGRAEGDRQGQKAFPRFPVPVEDDNLVLGQQG